jgi:AI-2 transport protein TqsA
VNVEPPRLQVPPALTGSLVIVAAVALGAALAAMRPVLVPLTLAIFVAYLVAPLVDVLQVRLRVRHGLAVLSALTAAGALVVVAGLLIASSVESLAEKGPIYQQRVVQAGQGILNALAAWGFPVDVEALKARLADLPVSSLVFTALDEAVKALTTLFLVLIFAIYLVAGHVPRRERSGLSLEIHERIKRYVVVKVASSVVTGVLVGGILAALGLDLAFVFGLLAFGLNFVPSVGAIIATLLPLGVAFVQFDSAVTIALVAALPAAVQIVLGNVVEPRFLGSALSLHPITVLLSLVFWGMLWGVPGMLLAAPITALADLLGGKLPGD